MNRKRNVEVFNPRRRLSKNTSKTKSSTERGLRGGGQKINAIRKFLALRQPSSVLSSVILFTIELRPSKPFGPKKWPVYTSSIDSDTALTKTRSGLWSCHIDCCFFFLIEMRLSRYKRNKNVNKLTDCINY